MIQLNTFLFSLLLIISSISSNAQHYNRPTPENLFPYQFEKTNNTIDNGYYFLTPLRIGLAPNHPNYKKPYPLILDKNGYIYWYSTPFLRGCIDFKYYPNSDLYSFTASYGQDSVNYIILDQNLNFIDTINAINQLEDVHDIQKLSNGNWMLATIHSDTVDLTGYTFNGIAGKNNTPIKGFGFQELDNNGNVVIDWNSNDYIHPSETYDTYGYDSTFFDYCHGNAIEEDTDGNILLSLRHLNSIYKINRTSGDIIWKLGGKSSDFTFVNDSFFSGQHDIRKLDNGNYSLFDNGNMSTSPRLSRGVEYDLDTTNWTATFVKEYIHPESIYGRAMGGYQTVDNDTKLISYGLIFRPSPSAVVIDDNQAIASQLYLKDSVMTYRFHHFTPNLPSRPQITCEQTLTGWKLNSSTANSYQWSTGETSQSISVTSTDTIQVWTPFGSGFIGSEPLIITDINAPCLGVGIKESKSTNLDEPFKLINLLGQPIYTPKENNIYIRVYESGFTERIIFNTTILK